MNSAWECPSSTCTIILEWAKRDRCRATAALGTNESSSLRTTPTGMSSNTDGHSTLRFLHMPTNRTTRVQQHCQHRCPTDTVDLGFLL
eukprot:113752-Pyramimonas_sp.AAC.2